MISLTEKNSFQELAKIAIKNRLFVSGWLLNSVLHQIKNGTLLAKVVLHYENNTPVAVAVNIVDASYFDYKTMVFVRKTQRNKGIGSKILKELDAPKNSQVGKGVNESVNFWLKNGYKIFF